MILGLISWLNRLHRQGFTENTQFAAELEMKIFEVLLTQHAYRLETKRVLEKQLVR